MVLNDYLQTISPDEVIYLGCDSIDKAKYKSNGSGFVYIGYAKDAPVKLYGKRYVRRTYPHECDYGGMTVIVEGTEAGRYWFWHEEDPSVPLKEVPMQDDPIPFENLLVAIAKQTIADYRHKLRTEIRNAHLTDMMEVDDLISVCRKTTDLEFLKGSNIGDYMIQSVEDEERIFWKYPKALKYEAEKKTKFLEKKRAELMRERIKKNESKKYAHIKGRSVWNGADR